MWIMVSGPYTGGAKSEGDREENLKRMNEAAVAVFDRGHIPIIGVNLALPIIQVAGTNRFEELMMPISLAAADRCDACLRIGGESKGADEEAELFKARGLPVYRSIEDVPVADSDTV